MRLKVLQLLVAAILCTGPVFAQVIRDRNRVVDAEIHRLPSCAVELKNGQWYLRSKFLRLYFRGSSTKLAWAFLAGDASQGGWVYFDRSGKFVVTNVATMDNGPNDFHFGLVRVVKDRKYGLADKNGKLVVPYSYDGMLDYEPKHGWRVCRGCHSERHGEYGVFVDGSWYWLDRKGFRTENADAPPKP